MNIAIGSIFKIANKLEISRVANLASPIVAIVISVIIAIFVVWPKFTEVLRLRGANDQLAIRAKSLEEKAQKLQSLDRTLLEQQLVASEQLLPSDKAVFFLIRQIEQAAGASGVLLSRVDVAPGLVTSSKDEKKPTTNPSSSESGKSPSGESNEPATKIQIKVSVGSDYKSFLQFLTNLLSISRVISVKELALSASSSESSQLKANLTIDGYWQALPLQLPSIESPITEISDSESTRLERIRTTGLSSAPQVPAVPLGRSDLFAPF